MLVLTRKVGESIQIGDQIRIVVTQVGGNRVRIGIEAPQQVNVRRQEVELAGPADGLTSCRRLEACPR